MHSDTEEIHCMVFVSGKDMALSISKLIERLGFDIQNYESSNNIIELSREYPHSDDHFPGNTFKKNMFAELISASKKQASHMTCLALTENEFFSVVEKIDNCIHRTAQKQANQKTLDEIEKEYVLGILDMHEWKYKTAAKHLGIDRSTLYRKLKKYGISKRK
ncbi:MAG: hypothetical protein JXB48_09280 [Candidatus Latescibacteria bacterium]|nr:hypothetical protein [Candidatus Latescibacterota bacterium]